MNDEAKERVRALREKFREYRDTAEKAIAELTKERDAARADARKWHALYMSIR